MISDINYTVKDAPIISSSVSYECHNLLLFSRVMKEIDLDDLSDDEDEHDYDDEASDCGDENDCEDFSNIYLRTSKAAHGDALSAEVFQPYKNKRKVHAVINDVNLLSYGLDWNEEDEDIGNNCTDVLEERRSLGVDCSDTNIGSKLAKFCVRTFERQAIEKKIKMGKIRLHDTGSESKFQRFQYVKTE